MSVYEIAAPDGRRFEIQVQSPAASVVKEKASVFVGDRQRAELLGHVHARYEARDAKGASLGLYASTFDAGCDRPIARVEVGYLADRSALPRRLTQSRPVNAGRSPKGCLAAGAPSPCPPPGRCAAPAISFRGD